MNHAKEMYIANHTILDLGHRKFAVKYIPRCKLPLTSVSSNIFAIYTFLPWFIYYIFVLCGSFNPESNFIHDSLLTEVVPLSALSTRTV